MEGTGGVKGKVRREKRISNIEQGISNDEVRKIPPSTGLGKMIRKMLADSGFVETKWRGELVLNVEF